MIKITAISALKDNYIWMITHQNSKTAWIVDPGDATPVIETLKNQNLTLAGILITHHHPDHSGGILKLLDYTPDIPVYASTESPLTSITHRISENSTIECEGFTLKATTIPGHTLDHIAYVGDRIVFCGDTLFSAGCGRIFEGNPKMMYESLGKLAALSEATNIYCGHEYTLANLIFAEHVEPNNTDIKEKISIVKKLMQQNTPTLPATLAEEKLINPFLRCEHDTVREAVETYAKKKLPTSVDVFQHLREWKNHFVLP